MTLRHQIYLIYYCILHIKVFGPAKYINLFCIRCICKLSTL